MTTYMTHVAYADAYATVPGTDTGVGATMPLSHEQRHGNACTDCQGGWGAFLRRYVGTCEDGPVYVCQTCYEQRLFDHIDYYRPQS